MAEVLKWKDRIVTSSAFQQRNETRGEFKMIHREESNTEAYCGAISPFYLAPNFYYSTFLYLPLNFTTFRPSKLPRFLPTNIHPPITQTIKNIELHYVYCTC